MSKVRRAMGYCWRLIHLLSAWTAITRCYRLGSLNKTFFLIFLKVRCLRLMCQAWFLVRPPVLAGSQLPSLWVLPANARLDGTKHITGILKHSALESSRAWCQYGAMVGTPALEPGHSNSGPGFAAFQLCDLEPIISCFWGVWGG